MWKIDRILYNWEDFGGIGVVYFTFLSHNLSGGLREMTKILYSGQQIPAKKRIQHLRVKWKKIYGLSQIVPFKIIKYELLLINPNYT
jgi:hypothetical protein